MSFILNDKMDTEQMSRRLSYQTLLEEDKEYSKDSYKQFIFKVIEYYNENEDNDMLQSYVNEILHSVLSLAIIDQDNITPDSLFSPQVFESLREEFPEPFNKYKTHLPRRTPFSVLLDIVNLKYDTKEKVLTELCNFFENLKFNNNLDRQGNKKQHFYTLESTVICVCFSSQETSVKYFGASVGCRTKLARRIMIRSSCINTWHDDVSYVVMSHMQHRRKGVSNSSLPCLEFPRSMECQAYFRDWPNNTYVEKPPCLNCQRMFGLPGNQNTNKSSPYGNCAETECLSKVLLDSRFRENGKINNFTNDKMIELKKVTSGNLRSDLSLISSFKSILKSMECLPVFNP